MRVTKWITISLIALTFSCLGASRVSAEDGHGTKVRWDIFQLEDITATSAVWAPGGISTSQATFYPSQGAGDNSTITLTGSGTFRLDNPHDVTGGGTWATAAADGTVTGSGTYQVTELVSFVFGPGSAAGFTGINDEMGNLADTHAGLAVLKVHYSDGTKGIVVVVCSLGYPQTPQEVIEGTTATKGYVDYSNPLIPTGATGNTLFHVIHNGD
jgi:hypothetical protein